MGEVKISPTQLGLVMMGFLFGDFNIMNPAKGAFQDAWLAFIVGWAGGAILIGMYLWIAHLNPNKTLVEIFLDRFGKYIGSLLSILYIWYFLHIASLIFRSFMEYMITVNYPEMSILVPAIASMIVIAYMLRSGIEVVFRLLALVVTILLIFTIVVSLFLIGEYDIKHMQPLLDSGWKNVLRTGYSIVTFPFGEVIIFLMIFPLLNKKEELIKTTSLAILIGGSFVFSTVIRDLLVLGPDLLFRTVFPPHIVGSLIPGLVLEPMMSTNLLISGGAMVIPSIYAALKGIQQLSGVDDYKPFVLVVCSLVVTISLWLYDSIPEMFEVSKDIYPFYVIPFQIVIPLVILIVSLIKNKKQAKLELKG